MFLRGAALSRRPRRPSGPRPPLLGLNSALLATEPTSVLQLLLAEAKGAYAKARNAQDAAAARRAAVEAAQVEAALRARERER